MGGFADRRRGLLKFACWGLIAAGLFAYAIRAHTSGTMVAWYYHRATADGYAVNTRAFEEATPGRPARLHVGRFGTIDATNASIVRAGDRLPPGATGVIDLATVGAGIRVRLEGDQLVVLEPWRAAESRGFAFREGFTHQNVRTNPASGVWNLAMVLLMGLSLGLMAEGFTDFMGVRLSRSDHTISR